MSLEDKISELLATVEQPSISLPPAAAAKAQKQTEQPWAAGVTLDGDNGVIASRPQASANINWNDELESWGFDPSLFSVVEPVRVSTWEVLTKVADGKYETKQLWAYRANIISRKPLSFDLDDLTAPILKSKPKTAPAGDAAFVVPIGDWQIGKTDGDGLAGTIERIQSAIDNLELRVKQLRKSGHKLGTLVIASLGDLGEGCNGHYEQQTFSVELDRRDQNKVVRRLARNLLLKLAPMFDEVIVAAVAGNHGENRQNGKSFTSTNDNDDVAIWESIAEAFAMNPEAFGHIKWLLPRQELSVSFEVNGKVLGLAHGHQAKGFDISKWWQAQSLANRPVAAADILLTGHFHHFKLVEVAKAKWWLQVPSLDGGSLWFEEMRGAGNSHGQVCFVLDENGWRELEVL